MSGKQSRSRALVITALLAAVPLLAQAHGGASASIATAFLHPFAGLERLLAMLGVGALAARCDGRARWALPAAFPFAMSLAAQLAAHGQAAPATEALDAGSVPGLALVAATV
jgi:urease accessory protein